MGNILCVLCIYSLGIVLISNMDNIILIFVRSWYTNLYLFIITYYYNGIILIPITI